MTENTEVIERTPKLVEFSIDHEFEKLLPPIFSNVKELGEWAKSVTQADRNAIVTGDSIPDYKQRRADINRVLNTIEDERKKVKKAYSKPYDDFEKELKVATNALKAASEHIGEQIKAFDEAKKAEKAKILKDRWEELSKEFYTVDWEFAYNQKWTNTTVSLKTAFEEMDRIQAEHKKNILLLRDLAGCDACLVVDYYRKGHDLTACIEYDRRIKALKAESEQKPKEEPKTSNFVAKEAIEPLKNVAPVASAETETADGKDEESFVIVMEVEATESKLMALQSYMKQNGIKFRKPKNLRKE